MTVTELIEKLKLMPPDAPVQLFHFTGEHDEHNSYDEVETVEVNKLYYSVLLKSF